MVTYERWRRYRQPELLDEIERYNELDCRSTRLCRDWLLSLRPTGATWFIASHAAAPEEATAAGEGKAPLREAERRTAAMIGHLLDGVAEAERPWRELLAYLLDFHRREAKPAWWATFTRLDMTEEELIDDAECIGGLRRSRPADREGEPLDGAPL
jgi:uncharacterized protein